jgi:hypothetical protein
VILIGVKINVSLENRFSITSLIFLHIFFNYWIFEENFNSYDQYFIVKSFGIEKFHNSEENRRRNFKTLKHVRILEVSGFEKFLCNARKKVQTKEPFLARLFDKNK